MPEMGKMYLQDRKLIITGIKDFILIVLNVFIIAPFSALVTIMIPASVFHSIIVVSLTCATYLYSAFIKA
jgi:hypothetical protein